MAEKEAAPSTPPNNKQATSAEYSDIQELSQLEYVSDEMQERVRWWAKFRRLEKHKNIGEYLGIRYTRIEKDMVEAQMYVDERHHQPLGLLHGGVSVVLAEDVASIAGSLHVPDMQKQFVVGSAITANHIRSVTSGKITATATAQHKGRRQQVWQINLRNEKGDLICASYCTLAVLNFSRHRTVGKTNTNLYNINKNNNGRSDRNEVPTLARL